MAVDLSFEVHKYSEALTPAGSPKIDWTHISGSNLHVRLEGSDATLRMDIVQGMTLLERLNVAEYVDRAKLLREARHRSGASLKLEELPVFGIAKDPVLALRYQRDDKARRVQLRLKRSEDFQGLMGLLSKRGMEFSQQRPSTGRPVTALDRPSEIQQGGTGRPLTSSSSQSVQQGHSSNRSRPNPFKVPDIEAGSLSQRPRSNVLQPADRTGRLVSPARESIQMDARDIHRPFFAQRGPSQPSKSLQSDVYDVQQCADAQVDESATTTNPNKQVPNNAAEEFFQFSTMAPGAVQGGFRPLSQRDLSSGGIQSHAPATSSDPSEARPSTAISVTSAASIFPDTLESEIPPPRTLPFKSTSTLRPSSAVSNPSEPSLAATLKHDVPPHRELPFARPVSRTSGAAPSQPGTALPPRSKKVRPIKDRPKTASVAQKRPSEVNLCGPGSNDALEPMERMRFPVQSNLSFATSRSAPDRSECDPGNIMPMKDLIFGGGRLPSSARPRIDSTVDAPHEIETPPGSAEKQQPAAIPQGARFPVASTTLSAEGNAANGYPNTDASPAPNPQILDLDQYASQTPEARQAAMTNFMVDMLQDPSFTTLCEDTENCWRRIALGL